MNKTELHEIISDIINVLPDNLNGAEKADIYAYLGVELGLSHLLMPEAVPAKEDQIELPTKAPEFYQKRTDRREKPCDFILRVYKKWHGKGLAKHHLLHLDEPLYMALCNWLIKNDAPDGFDLPTKKELNDRELERLELDGGEGLPYPSYYKELKDKLRLYNAARNRRG